MRLDCDGINLGRPLEDKLVLCFEVLIRCRSWALEHGKDYDRSGGEPGFATRLLIS